MKKHLIQSYRILQNIENAYPYLSLIANNITIIYLVKKKYLKAFRYVQAGLMKMEAVFFKNLKENKKNAYFLDILMILLQGYLNYACCLNNLKKLEDEIEDEEIVAIIRNKEAKIFYKNGLKLARKFLEQNNKMLKKFEYLSHNYEEIKKKSEVPQMIVKKEFKLKS